MKRFITKTLIFLLSPLIIIGLTLLAYTGIVGKENLPAMNFSNSYSFNEKIHFLKKTSISPKIIAIGSSMTLNNLHSDVVTNQLQTDEYLNVSSWGLKINETYQFLKNLYDLYEFKQVILVINAIDFQKELKEIDYRFVDNYLTHQNLKTTLSFAQNFDIHYYLTKIPYAYHAKNCSTDYEYLNYDQFGMVKFIRDDFNINDKRWMDKKLDIALDETEYLYLDSISNFCAQNHLEYYVLHSPYRKGLVDEFTLREKEKYNSHLAKVASKITKSQHFVNSNDTVWGDSLFVDATHFNESGARLFTQYCFEKLRL